MHLVAVIPPKGGIHRNPAFRPVWIPAFAGRTGTYYSLELTGR